MTLSPPPRPRNARHLFRVLLCVGLCLGSAAPPPAACREAPTPPRQETKPETAHDSDHDCLDEAQWAEWDALLAKYPTDEDIITLYALRAGLCALVLKGQVEARTAIRLFEHAHQTVIGKAIEREAAGEERQGM